MNVTLQSAPVPQGFCALTDAQWQILVHLMTATVNLIQGPINKSITEPAADQRAFPWYRLLADGSPDRIYNYVNGMWLSRHPLPPGTIIISELTVDEVPLFDGGEGTNETDSFPTTGPMWKRVDELSARFPIGAGDLPQTSTHIGLGATGGKEVQTHNLTVPQLPAHAHELPLYDLSGENTDTSTGFFYVAGQDLKWQAGSAARTSSPVRTAGAGEVISLNIMPPYYTVRFIRRTARLFYRY